MTVKGVGVVGGASRILLVAEAFDRDRLLEHAELRLAAPREQLRDGLAGRLRDLPVEIDELAAEAPG